jgi:hypothetical protein
LQGWVWSLNYNANQGQLVSTGWDYHIHLWQLTDDSVRHQSSINCRTALLCADVNSDHLVNPIEILVLEYCVNLYLGY